MKPYSLSRYRFAITIVAVCKAALLSVMLATPAMAELPQISDARVVQPPPGSKVAAAYFTINNSGNKALDITDAASDIAKKVEVHLSFVENDVAKMQKQEQVSIPAGESLEFKHGSYHVMFMGLNKELLAGESMQLTLTTSAGDLTVTVPIISLEDAMQAGSGDKEKISADGKHEGTKKHQH